MVTATVLLVPVKNFRLRFCSHQGDILKVVQRADNGWWLGYVSTSQTDTTLDETLGWFPSNYVEAVPSA